MIYIATNLLIPNGFLALIQMWPGRNGTQDLLCVQTLETICTITGFLQQAYSGILLIPSVIWPMVPVMYWRQILPAVAISTYCPITISRMHHFLEWIIST